MKLSPQCQRIYDFLRDHPEGLTSGEAARWVPQVMRISERIREMEREGIAIEKAGEGHGGVHYVRYFLAQPKARQQDLFHVIARGDLSFRKELDGQAKGVGL